MTARWLLLTLLTLLAFSFSDLHAQQSTDRSGTKSEDSRTPGRFFRKLRDDFSGRKDEEDKANSKPESPRTAQRGETPTRENADREAGGLSSLFSPPAFLGGPGASRRDQQQDRGQQQEPDPNVTSQSRPPFKFSQPTLPPPVAETLPRPNANSGQRPPAQLPPPPRNQATKPQSSRQSAQSPNSNTRPELGQPEPAPQGRQLDFASTPIASRKQPKPSTKEGFGFELVDRDGGVFIDKVKPKGNADQAELRKGDRIAKIGGVEVELIEQFEEIAQMLENGDQIEIVISRRGKEEDVTLQFGQAPAVPEAPAESTQTAPPEFRLSQPGEIPDFAPPASESSRYEPGVTELPEENETASRASKSNGFRSPSLPAERDTSNGYAEAEYQRVIRQQQEQIRQLQAQLQQMRQQQLRTQQPPQSNQRGRR
ncbi:MAG: PDZ domain-containing protein [Planctomycetota bacterium]